MSAVKKAECAECFEHAIKLLSPIQPEPETKRYRFPRAFRGLPRKYSLKTSLIRLMGVCEDTPPVKKL